MKKITAFLVAALVVGLAGVAVLDSAELTWEPKRVNKAIELLEAGQPIYYTSSHGGYEEGKKMAQTWADYINYDMEHHPYDIAKLQAFMRGAGRRRTHQERAPHARRRRRLARRRVERGGRPRQCPG